MRRIQKTFVCASVVITALVSEQPTALAQDDQRLEEIVVTAQRREQNVLNVPVSLDVLTQEDLAGLSDVKDLFQVAPTVQYQGGVSSGGQAITVRGIGGGGFSSAFEHSVSVVIDQIATGPSGSALVDFWDVARIEVLNGPQGTLFGKNVSAGLINIVTNDPTEEFEGMAAVSYESEYEELRVDGVLNGPITDSLNARLAFYWRDQGEGIVDNPIRNTTENKKDSLGVRLKTAYESDSFEFNMALTYEKQDNECCSRVYTSELPQFANLFATLASPRIAANGIVPSLDNRSSISEGLIFDNIESLSGAWELVWELGSGHQIKSITGYRDWDQEDWNDVDGVDINIIEGGLTHEMTLFSEEIQLVSPSGGDLEYILGLYYYNYDIEETTILDGLVDVVGVYLRTDWETGVEVENIAAFGHVNYRFNDRWSGFAGARLLREEQKVDGRRFGTFLGFAGDLPAQQGSIDDTDWMGTIGLQHFPSENVMLYGSYSRGYKGGHIDNTIGSAFFLGNINDVIVDPETVDSFELGAKLTALDNRLRLTATAYFSEFDDFQASAFDGNASSWIFTNAGVLQSRGLELDVVANPWDGGSLSFALAYVDAEYDEFLGATCTVPQTMTGNCDPAAGDQNLSGRAVNNSPEWRYVIGGRQNFRIGNADAYFRAEYAWRDDIIFDGDQDPSTAVDSYGLLSARLAAMPTEKVEVALWGRNLTDETYFVRVIDAPLENGLYSGYMGPGRQYGVEMIVRF